MSARTLRPAWVASSALTVLAGACAAAVALSAAPVTGAAPVAPPPVRVAAQQVAAPTPVSLAFAGRAAAPAPRTPAARKPAARAQAPAPASVRTATRSTDSRCSGAGWQSRRGTAAVAGLRRPADARAVPIAFRPASTELLGLADLHARTIEVFVRPCGRQSDALLRHVIAHELGHILDVTHLDREARMAWKAARGIPASTPWFGCDSCSDFETPAGDFAETYAQWQRGATTSRSKLAPAPSPAELQRLAATFFSPL